MKPRILISNDDGIQATGLLSLVEALEPLGEVWVVAPENEQSATSHSLSLHRPLRVREIQPRRFSVDGTPVDCVYLAVNHLMKNVAPDLVVSGINHGANLADDVIYSGTVAAAMEGYLLGFRSIAFSLAGRIWNSHGSFAPAARFARAFVEIVLGQKEPARFLLNVNVPPNVEPLGCQVTRLGKHNYTGEVIERKDPRNRTYYWLGGTGYEHDPSPGTDCTAVLEDRCISITPMQVDMTDAQALPQIASWPVPEYLQRK